MATYSITSTTQSGQFSLEATRDKDLPTIVNDTGVELCIAIGSTGEVSLYSTPADNSSLAVFNQKVDANGHKLDPGIYKRYGFRYRGMPAGALIAETKDPDGKTLSIVGGSDYFVYLPPRCSTSFIVNDDPKWFSDNSGEFVVSYASVAR